MENLNIIPAPKSVISGNRSVPVSSGIYEGPFPEAARCLVHFLLKKLPDTPCRLCDADSAGVRFEKSELLCADEYRLDITEAGAICTCGGKKGAFCAASTLLQLALAHEDKMLLPAAAIADRPDSAYRGLLIDCARSRHSVENLKRYIDLCFITKLSQLHLHLTDDENYTLPSRLFPSITTEKFSYSFEDIKELTDYAAACGVGLVPEIDTPGHSTAMRTRCPEAFGKNEGIICFHKDTVNSVRALYGELCDMFGDSEYIHIGGDESRLGWWLDCKDCIDYGRSLGYKEEDPAPGMSGNEYVMLRYLAHFIKESASEVLQAGKTPIAWEGFHKATNDIVPKECAVMVFDSSYQLPPSLCEAGFKIINCSWLPTYVVTPVWHYSQKDCFNWDIYSYGTINESSPYHGGHFRMEPTDSVIGGQLSSWGDAINKDFPTLEDGLADEFEKICRRAPAIAENTWNREKRRDFADFKEAASRVDKLFELI